MDLTATDPSTWAAGAIATITVVAGFAALLGRARRGREPTAPAAPATVATEHTTVRPAPVHRTATTPMHVNGHHFTPPAPSAAHPAPPAEGERKPDQPLTLEEMTPAAQKLVKAMATSMGVCVVALIALGLLGSFTTQVKVVEPWFDEWAWIVPVVADVGAIVLIQGDFLLTLYGLRIRWLRAVTSLWLLGTLALNLSAAKGGDLDEYVGHALLPLVVIVFTELARALLARWAKLQAPDTRGGYEPLPKIRWVLQPMQTWLLWRRRKLLGLQSLQEVTDAEARYALARGHLRHTYGWTRLKLFWRIRAPREMMWALNRDLLMGRGADEVAAIVSNTLFGKIKREMEQTSGMQIGPGGADPAVDGGAVATVAGSADTNKKAAPQPPTRPKPGGTRPVPAQKRRTPTPARPPAQSAAASAAPTSEPVTSDTAGGDANMAPATDSEWASWNEIARRGYEKYEKHLLATGEEIDCKTLADDLGKDAGYLRTVRQKKWRPRYARMHGADSDEAPAMSPAAGMAPQSAGPSAPGADSQLEEGEPIPTEPVATPAPTAVNLTRPDTHPPADAPVPAAAEPLEPATTASEPVPAGTS